jgi:DNA-binding MarR family transcriptional regulator
VSRSSRTDALSRLNREVRGWQADQELFDSLVIDLAGVNRTDFRCLDILGTRGPMTAGELADAVRLTTGAITGVLDRLEGAGLVRRVRDTGDRRRVIVEVTEELDRLGAPVYGPLVADAAKTHGGFTVKELEVITRFIRAERELLARHTTRLRELPAENPALAPASGWTGGSLGRAKVDLEDKEATRAVLDERR